MRFFLALGFATTFAVVGTFWVRPAPTPIMGGLVASRIEFRTSPGASETRQLLLSNQSPESVCIQRAETSCDCLRVQLPKQGLTIAPNTAAEVTVVLNLSHDPAYVGGFAPEVKFFDQAGACASVASVEVEVRK